MGTDPTLSGRLSAAEDGKGVAQTPWGTDMCTIGRAKTKCLSFGQFSIKDLEARAAQG